MSDDDFVRKIVEKALGKVSPSEHTSNSMTTPLLSPTILWRPNNYRLGIQFRGVPDSSLGTVARHTGLIFWRKGNITVQVGKRLIVGIWNQGKDRQTWRIERDSLSALEQRLDEVRVDIMDRIKSVVLEYVSLSKIEVIGDFGWLRHEDWVKGDEYIDRIPKEFTIHDTVFKKVYNESAIEFIGGRGKPGTVEVKQYIKNRVIEDFAPEVVSSMNALRDEFRDALNVFKVDALVPLTEQLRLHLAVESKQNDNMDKMNVVLSRLDAHLGKGSLVSPVYSIPFPYPESVGGEKTPKTRVFASFGLPPTISKYDVEARNKVFRVFRARQLLVEYGWGNVRW